MIQKINSIEDVISFTKYLLAEGVNFHPDDPFEMYVNMKTGKATYSTDEAAIRNHLMQQAFNICQINNIDIYNFTMTIYLKETKLDQLIPLPFPNNISIK